MSCVSSLVILGLLALNPGGDASDGTKPAGQDSLKGESCTCPADFDQSGLVDGADLGQLLASWGQPTADLNDSGSTDGADLGILLAQWGPCFVVAANDFCENAINIGEGTIEFCTFGAQTQPPAFPIGSPCTQFGYDSIYADVWYRYTATAFGTLTVSTCGTAWDTRLAAYAHAFPNSQTTCPVEEFSFITITDCNDDYAPCGLASTISFSTIPNKVYLIRVGGYEGFSGNGTLNVDFTSEGQTCEDAIDLGFTSSSGIYVLGTTLDNDPATDVSPCGFGDTVPEWYSFTADCSFASPDITISTCHGPTDFDTVVSVWEEGTNQCVGAFVACNDDDSHNGCQIDGFNRKSRLSFEAKTNQRYVIRVSGYSGAVGDFELTVLSYCD